VLFNGGDIVPKSSRSTINQLKLFMGGKQGSDGVWFL